MIISLPRSGSTWAANWLTGERIFCLHDPLWTIAPDDLDARLAEMAPGRVRGIACTGLWRWPSWVNRHPARKLVLHRPRADVARSLDRLGLPRLPIDAERNLNAINGRHVDWFDLFSPEPAREIWDYLTGGEPFDAARHAQLVAMQIEPKFDAVTRDRALNARLSNMDLC